MSKKWHQVLHGLKELPSSQLKSQKPVVQPSSVLLFKRKMDELPTAVFEPVSRKTFKELGLCQVTRLDSATSLALLKKFHGENAKFRSVEQHLAVDVALFTKENMLCIFPTSLGKSLLFILNASNKVGKTSFVIVPTISLKEDMVRRAKDYGFSIESDWEHFSHQRLMVLVTDAAVTVKSFGMISKLSQSKILDRIFIDEAHCFVTDSSYRDCMLDLPILRTFGVPITFLTATAPIDVKEKLLSNFFPRSQPRIIQMRSNRSNIRYSVEKYSSKNVLELFNTVQEIAKELLREERMIFYFTTIRQCEEMASRFGRNAVKYHGSCTEEYNEQSFTLWRNGGVKIICATSAFGVGVDFGAVKFVVFQDLPYTFVDYVQQSGRAGRNGCEAKSILFIDADFEKRQRNWQADRQESGATKLYEYALARGCRRQLISQYMDGVEVACFRNGGSYCDNCSREPMFAVEELGPDDLAALQRIQEQRFAEENIGYVQVIEARV